MSNNIGGVSLDDIMKAAGIHDETVLQNEDMQQNYQYYQTEQYYDQQQFNAEYFDQQNAGEQSEVFLNNTEDWNYAWSSSDYQMAPVMLNQETFTENAAYYSCANNKKGKTTSKKVVIVLLIVSLILISGVGAWYFVNMEEQPVLESDATICYLNRTEMRDLISETILLMTTNEKSIINKAIYACISYEIEDETSEGYMVTFVTPDLFEIIMNMDNNISADMFDEYIINRLDAGTYPIYSERMEVMAQTKGKADAEVCVTDELRNILSGNLLNNYEKLD